MVVAVVVFVVAADVGIVSLPRVRRPVVDGVDEARVGCRRSRGTGVGSLTVGPVVSVDGEAE